jgi:hypothetical protein
MRESQPPADGQASTGLRWSCRPVPAEPRANAGYSAFSCLSPPLHIGALLHTLPPIPSSGLRHERPCPLSTPPTPGGRPLPQHLRRHQGPGRARITRTCLLWRSLAAPSACSDDGLAAPRRCKRPVSQMCITPAQPVLTCICSCTHGRMRTLRAHRPATAGANPRREGRAGTGSGACALYCAARVGPRAGGSVRERRRRAWVRSSFGALWHRHRGGGRGPVAAAPRGTGEARGAAAAMCSRARPADLDGVPLCEALSCGPTAAAGGARSCGGARRARWPPLR